MRQVPVAAFYDSLHCFNGITSANTKLRLQISRLVFTELFTLLSSFNYHGCYKLPAHESFFNTKLQGNIGIVQGYCRGLC